MIWKKGAVVGKRKDLTFPALPLPSFLLFYFMFETQLSRSLEQATVISLIITFNFMYVSHPFSYIVRRDCFVCVLLWRTVLVDNLFQKDQMDVYVMLSKNNYSKPVLGNLSTLKNIWFIAVLWEC